MTWSAGTYTRSDGTTGCQDDEAASVGVTSVKMDTRLNEVTTGINQALNKDGSNSPSANLPMNAKKHTNVAAGTARSDYAAMSNVQDSTAIWGGTSGGSANAQTLTLSPAITAYVAGQMFSFIAGFTITSSSTLNVNTVGAKNIKLMGGASALVNTYQGSVIVGSVYTVIYDGTQFILLNPTQPLAYATSVSAAGTLQSDATAFDAEFLQINGGTGGVKLPAATPGRRIWIYNVTGSSVNVYPPVSGTIGAAAANTPLVLPSHQGAIFWAYTTTAYNHISTVTL